MQTKRQREERKHRQIVKHGSRKRRGTKLRRRVSTFKIKRQQFLLKMLTKVREFFVF